ncbi:hypothetical protein ANCCEY_11732 [Ancylostoma ceylanicum]|uniref:Protein kinase domain-containing protein n=1 Tax=Ancylostoma ceylanicum TaxID=53326 RepID=A0A0D6LNG3_9BILA|nr:hypothetical protein ANCCEY_11732 [Ancylostoma ceylanicum]
MELLGKNLQDLKNGRPNQIYMLDFGISKRLCPTSADEMSLGGRFKGTIRYASMACHRCQELGPRDDCESWLYMMVDLVSPMSLPWRNAKNRNDVLQIKEEVRGEKLSLFLCGLKCKDGVVKIMRYIDNLKGTDEVDYSFLLETVEQDAKRAKCDISAPYDWEFSRGDKFDEPRLNVWQMSWHSK